MYISLNRDGFFLLCTNLKHYPRHAIKKTPCQGKYGRNSVFIAFYQRNATEK